MKMKSIKSLFAVALAVITLFSVCITAFAGREEVSIGKHISWNIDENGTLYIKGWGEMIIAETPGNFSPFHCWEDVKKVVIERGVTSIADEAFWECSNMTEVIIPDTVTEIGYMAFRDCDNIKNVYYGGNESDRENIIIEKDNEDLIESEWHYNYQTATSGFGFFQDFIDAVRDMIDAIKNFFQNIIG